MSAAARKHGAVMQVWLSVSETQEWGTDEKFRLKLVADFKRAARDKGRRHYQVFSNAGEPLASGAAR